tara:strand:+ start:118 stop:804 length:687 start_codon:yes stop_codon:yes gene_type:complete
MYIALNSQEFKLFEKESFVYENDTINYRVLKPLGYNPNKQYSVHLFLHGSGERVNDNSWVIFPQCSKNDRWPSLSSDQWDKTINNKIKKPNKGLGLVIKLMDEFIQKKLVDKQRIYVSGLSMGGMGTFEILYRRPNMFAAATPICGNGITQLAKLYANKVPVWIFHGLNDNVVSPKHSLAMAKAIIEADGSPKMTLYENTGHGGWNNAFAEKKFLNGFTLNQTNNKYQ